MKLRFTFEVPSKPPSQLRSSQVGIEHGHLRFTCTTKRTIRNGIPESNQSLILTNLVIVGQPLQVPDKPLERKTPPGVDGTEKEKEVVDVKRYVVVSAIRITLWVESLHSSQPLGNISPVLLSTATRRSPLA